MWFFCLQQGLLQNTIDDGQVILVNSLSGHRVSRNRITRFYSATKYAVTALLEGWRQELKDHDSNILMGQLSPGMVRTEFLLVQYANDTAKAHAVYNSMECLTAEDMAECLKLILVSPPRMQIHDILVRPTQQRY